MLSHSAPRSLAISYFCPVPGTPSFHHQRRAIVFCRGHTSFIVLPSYIRPFFISVANRVRILDVIEWVFIEHLKIPQTCPTSRRN